MEELVSTRRKFEGALGVIGTKLTTGTSKSQLLAVRDARFDARGVIEKNVAQKLVLYWTDGNRLTWYQLNEELFESLCRELYSCKVQNDVSLPPKVQNDLNMETDKSGLHGKGELDFSCAESINGSPDDHASLTQTVDKPQADLYVSSEREREEKSGGSDYSAP